MIKFTVEEKKVILSYTSDESDSEWVYLELKRIGKVKLSKVFQVTSNDLISTFNPDSDSEDDSVRFQVALEENSYYCFKKEFLSLNHDLFIHNSIKIERKLFAAIRGISVFGRIDKLVDNSIYIGGDGEEAIPESVFRDLLSKFPNTYELNSYASARISSVISSYIETKEDYEEKYQKYFNRKVSKEGIDLQHLFSNIEFEKYTTILEKLNYMLDNEISYNESQWQKEILQIILLLYPKYIHVFEEAPVRDSYCDSNRKIDYLLVDSSGHTDIVEIKKPFDKCIVTQRTYRDNYIPLRELSGTVMQIEKYIFHLNKWGKKGEEKLTNKFKNQLAENFEIRITNPSALIIMGRTKGMTENQIKDFEVIKRKYKNVIDIITYDDLIDRLKFTILQWKEKST